jgi:hypothetical protein
MAGRDWNVGAPRLAHTLAIATAGPPVIVESKSLSSLTATCKRGTPAFQSVLARSYVLTWR